MWMDDEVQRELTTWGRFWRRAGYAHLGYPRVNTICRMMHAAKLGCTPQTSRREPDMHVPWHIAKVDLAISGLEQRDRAVLAMVYQRDINRKTLKRKSPVLHRALLRAEARIYPYL